MIVELDNPIGSNNGMRGVRPLAFIKAEVSSTAALLRNSSLASIRAACLYRKRRTKINGTEPCRWSGVGSSFINAVPYRLVGLGFARDRFYLFSTDTPAPAA
jgi:hypothetical protein